MTQTTQTITPAFRGTIIHKAMEIEIHNELDIEITSKLYNEYRDVKHLLDDNMKETAHKAKDQVVAIYEWYQKRDGGRAPFIKTEGYAHSKTRSGRTDTYIVSSDTIHIIDLKTGGAFEYNNPEDDVFKSYAAGVLNNSLNKIGKIRITVVNGINKKTVEYTAEDVKEWDREQKRKQDEELINNAPNEIVRRAEELRVMVEGLTEYDAETLNVLNKVSGLYGDALKKAGQQVEETGVAIEGYGMVESKRNKVDEEKLLDYISGKGYTMEEIILGAYKPHKKSIENNMDPDTLRFVEEEGIFYSEPSGNKAFRKKRR